MEHIDRAAHKLPGHPRTPEVANVLRLEWVRGHDVEIFDNYLPVKIVPVYDRPTKSPVFETGVHFSSNLIKQHVTALVEVVLQTGEWLLLFHRRLHIPRTQYLFRRSELGKSIR